MQQLAMGTLLALLVGVTPALANADSDRLQQAGMLGSWAVDCNAPPSQTNPYQLFAPSSRGSPTRAYQTSAQNLKVTHQIKDVQPLAENRIGAIWIDLQGESLRVVLLKVGNRHKGFESVRLHDGKVLVKNGRIVDSDGEPPWFTKCGAN